MSDQERYVSNALRLWRELDTMREIYLAEALARGEDGSEAFSKAANLSVQVYSMMQPHLQSDDLTTVACADLQNFARRLGE